MGDAPAAPARTIVVRDLDLACRIGVSDAERARAQTVRINVELSIDDHPLRDEDLGSVVDYSVLLQRLRDVAAGPPVRLVETLADRLLAACWYDPRIRSARVRVEKLDLHEDLGGVGIAVERHAPRS